MRLLTRDVYFYEKLDFFPLWAKNIRNVSEAMLDILFSVKMQISNIIMIDPLDIFSPIFELISAFKVK